MNRHGPIINHLAFADNTIIFSSGNKASLHLILNILATYERVSGQLINRSKSRYTMAPNVTQRSITRVGLILGMRFERLPIKYLSCTIYSGRKKLCFFSTMVSKVINKVKWWHLKFLSAGRRAVLISHVL